MSAAPDLAPLQAHQPCAACSGDGVPTLRLPVCPGHQAIYGAAVWLCYTCAVRAPGCLLFDAAGHPAWHVKPTWLERDV